MKNKLQFYLLCAVVALAVAVMVFSGSQYLSARKELSSLKADLEASTAAWKKTNEEKLDIQKELLSNLLCEEFLRLLCTFGY